MHLIDARQSRPQIFLQLKQRFPRLPMCLVVDGLYPNQTFFRLCRQYGWQWIVTFKKGNLPSVWRQIFDRQERARCVSRRVQIQYRGQSIRRTYHWDSGLRYQDFRIQWFTCTERIEHTVTEFTYLSSLEVNSHLVLDLTAAGRLRWKIENERIQDRWNRKNDMIVVARQQLLALPL
jgi:hypothetical protein